MEKTKTCIKIETEESYELFDNINKAFDYLKENYGNVINMSLVKANNTYQDKINGKVFLNYDDNSDTIQEELSVLK
jgi:NTP pyrophosphatase (non-canonical NTP hydrolase)